jgi:NDP-sugar pyrophosphorylase family protein
MIAVILAGGKGTRLKPFTMTIPKPLLPLGDAPILEVVLRQLSHAGFKRVVITLGYKARIFEAAIEKGLYQNMQIEYCWEKEPLGTAASLRLVPGLDDDFLVMNGDILTTLNYLDLFNLHCRQEAWGTIALHRREVNIDYGVVQADHDGFLQDYVEKPTLPYSVSMGVNVLSKRCLEFIPQMGRYDMPELMMAMQRAGKPVVCYETDCYWQDIGRFEDYQKASEDFVKDPFRFIPVGKKS